MLTIEQGSKWPNRLFSHAKTKNAMEEVLKNYLRKIASEIEGMIRDEAKKAQFLKSIEAYREMREKFLQALQQCQNEAVKNKLLYDENAEELPISKEEWEQGSELEDDYLIKISIEGKTVNKKFWRPPLPFDPDAWIRRYYGSPHFNDMVASPGVPKKPKEPNDTEDITCRYVVLAVIHDKSRDKPSSQKLTIDDDCEWVENLWSSIKWLKLIDGDNFEDRTTNINYAIDNLPQKPADTTLKIEPQGKDGQGETDMPDYRALDLVKRTISIGAETYQITSEKVWDFLKDLCSALKDDRLVPMLEGATNNKNHVDQLRRQIGKDNLHKLILFVSGGYKLNAEVKILGGGQIGIRKTHLSRNRK